MLPWSLKAQVQTRMYIHFLGKNAELVGCKSDGLAQMIGCKRSVGPHVEKGIVEILLWKPYRPIATNQAFGGGVALGHWFDTESMCIDN